MTKEEKDKNLEEQVVKKGGPEERSSDEELKSPKQFPTDYHPFYPHKNAQDIIDKTIKLAELKRRKEVPKDVQAIETIIESVTVGGRTMLKLTTTFQQDNDPNFNGAYLWIKGYQTENALADYDENNPNTNETGAEETFPFQKLQTMTRSPSTVYVERTEEKVILGVEAFNHEGVGSGIATMPVQTIELV